MQLKASIPLLILLAPLLHAEPVPGDADYPTRNGSPRHEEKVKAVRTGDFDLVLIGDSITHTLGDMNDGKYGPNLAVWKRHFEPLHALNLGMNGQRTQEILWNLQNGQLDFVKSPKVAMLLIGTNNADDRNFAKTYTPEQIFAGTKAIIDLIRQRHPATKILVLRIFPRGGDTEKAVSPPAFNSSAECIETCRRAGELTARLADGEHVFWLDVNHVFLRGDGTINTDLMWDLLHPSPEGAEAWVRAVEPTLAKLMGDEPIENPPIPLIKAALPTQTGLLLEPPLDLSEFTSEDFVAASSTVGVEKIHKKWTSPVTALPPHARQDAQGLTENEIQEYMLKVRDLFDRGASVPISDVGLISTQEDVIRRPMLNHIAAFANGAARVYLLVQKTSTDTGWGYFSIVQDLTVEPPMDYFGQINGAKVKFEGASCFKCHSSGPLAIHPAREDLVSDATLAAAISQHIADQPRSRFHFPERETKLEYGEPLALKACTKCHDTDGDRAPLYRVHSHPIRILADFGYMPPKHRLMPEEVRELKHWLEEKP
jgi:lysophospholipase L1-like esterase